ncbi:mechanosensitive ion channel family protein [Streptomyces thinghirensis]|nr:mechanosensitive ion channel family protein [Streptomyces thinghirensis]
MAYDANLDTGYRVLGGRRPCPAPGPGLRGPPARGPWWCGPCSPWTPTVCSCASRSDRAAPAVGVTRELRRRVKEALDEAGIDIPFPRGRVRVPTDAGLRARRLMR